MARKTPERYKTGPKKGQFKPKGARSKAPARKKTTTMRKAAHGGGARRTARRRNPDVVRQLFKGVGDAAYVVTGEVAASAIPRLAGLPSTGTVGLAAQAGAAFAVGMVADRFLGSSRGAFVLAGALAVPLRNLVIGAGIPIVSDALRGGMSSYVVPEARRGVNSYVRPRSRAVAGYGDGAAGRFLAAGGS